jgi:soluble lytic murein transglycosylase-like protein
MRHPALPAPFAFLALGALLGLAARAAAAGEVLSASIEAVERPAMAPAVHENLIDEMDVYALSPHAGLLRLPRMVRKGALAAAPRAYAARVFSQWSAQIAAAAEKFGVDAGLVAAVVQTESGFAPGAVSPKGAQGLMQLMPATARELGVADPFDPDDNIEAGTRYLQAQLARFQDVELALAAYNAGPGNVMKYGGIPPFAETQDFVRRVMARWKGQ